MATYIVEGTLNHDGVTFEHGSVFETDDEKLAARLRKATALRLPSEVQSAEATQSEMERLRARVAELEASQRTHPAEDSGGDASGEEEPPKSGESGEE